jgi:hypothetical protein
MRTELINDRKKDAVTIRESDGTPIVTLEPRDTDLIETDDPATTLAPYSEVQFIDEPPYAQLTPRPNFTPPQYKYPCTFILRAGKEWVEYVALRDRPLCLMRGVPVTVGLDLLDRYVLYNLVEVGVPALKRRASEKHDGIVEVYWQLEERCQNRPLEEVELIKNEIEAVAATAEEAPNG